MYNKPIIFDLELNDESKYRTLAETDWETFRHKKNKIMLGSPVCSKITNIENEESLSPDLRKAYAGYDLYRVLLSLTLLPDKSCKFTSVDFIMEIPQSNADPKAPLFLALEPASIQNKVAIKTSGTESGKLSIQDNVLNIVNAELGATELKEQQFERVQSQIQSFGLRSRKAGWRFSITSGSDISILSPDLTALIAVPANSVTDIAVKVTATIEIMTATDKFFTGLFLRNVRPGLVADFKIIEIL